MVKRDVIKNSFNLNKLKQEYEKLRKRYELPEFSELNKLFDIEEADVETEFLLRKIRRIILEKISDYLRFVEIILNPTNAPIYFFRLVKKLDNKNKETLAKIHETLSNLEIEVIALDLDYNEEKEAEFIKKCYNTFNKETKEKFKDIVKRLRNFKDNNKKINNGSYFG